MAAQKDENKKSTSWTFFVGKTWKLFYWKKSWQAILGRHPAHHSRRYWFIWEETYLTLHKKTQLPKKDVEKNHLENHLLLVGPTRALQVSPLGPPPDFYFQLSLSLSLSPHVFGNPVILLIRQRCLWRHKILNIVWGQALLLYRLYLSF
jgi:hypothetical protein